MIGNKKTLLAIAATLALTACGGGSSFTPATPTTPATAGTITGTAVDGLITGMAMLCDSNNNGVADTGEAVVSTNGFGVFSFTTACASTLIGIGGTSTDTKLQFKGQLKANPGSTYVTPLTGLTVNSGLTAAQVATALGLPADVDVSQTNPMVNSQLQKLTVAVNQINQQVAETLAALAGNSSPAALQTIYSNVTASMVAALRATPATPLISANGSVSSTLVSSVITGSLVQATANATLSVAERARLNTFSGASIAELTSSAIVAQAQTLAQSSDTALLANLVLLQPSSTISNAARGLSALLTTANAASVNMTSTGTALSSFAAATTSADLATAVAAINNAATAQASASSTTISAFNVNALVEQTNVLAIANDSIELNGQNYTLQTFATGTGVVLPARVSPLDTVRFVYQIKGTPIPTNAQGVTTSRVSLGVELSDTTSSGRKLEFILDQADVTINAGQLSVAIPASARLTAYGRTANGTNANVVLTNVGADDFVSVDGTSNQLSFNAGKVLAKLAAPGSTFANLQNITGTFNLKIAISNLSIAGQTPTSVKGLSVNVTGSDQTMTGLGVEGQFTIR